MTIFSPSISVPLPILIPRNAPFISSIFQHHYSGKFTSQVTRYSVSLSPKEKRNWTGSNWLRMVPSSRFLWTWRQNALFCKKRQSFWPVNLLSVSKGRLYFIGSNVMFMRITVRTDNDSYYVALRMHTESCKEFNLLDKCSAFSWIMISAFQSSVYSLLESS